MKEKLKYIFPTLLLIITVSVLSGCTSLISQINEQASKSIPATTKANSAPAPSSSSQSQIAVNESPSTVDEETSPINFEYVLMLDISSEENIALAKYDLDIEIDGRKITTLSNGANYKNSVPINDGTHTITFTSNKNASINSTEHFTTTGDAHISCSLKSRTEKIDIKDFNCTSGNEVIPSPETTPDIPIDTPTIPEQPTAPPTIPNPPTITPEPASPTVEETLPPSPPQPAVPSEYISALADAYDYSSLMHMSKKGIYDQLTSEYGEGYSTEAAQYAIDHAQIDYNNNALKSAATYVETMHMSKRGVYEQLVSEYGEQFTPSEAQFAIDNLNADYNKAALESAKSYKNLFDMSSSEIFDQLTSEYGDKFTAAEAQYAIDNLK